MGNVLIELNKLDEAIEILKRAIASNDIRSPPRTNLSRAYLEKHDFRKALLWADKALEIDPTNANAYNNKGAAHRGLGQFEQASEAFYKAIQLRPDDARYFLNLGNALSDDGKQEEAIKNYGRAFALNPYFLDALIARGIAFGRQKRLEQSISDFSQATAAAEKTLSDAYSCRGFSLQLYGQYSEALKNYEQAIRLNHANANAYRNRAELRLIQRDYEGALSDAKVGVQLEPNNADSIVCLAMALHSVGNDTAALRLWDEIAEKDVRYLDIDWMQNKFYWVESLKSIARTLIETYRRDFSS